MNRTERAKQFLPFDALRGLREELALREEKHSRSERKELSESQQQDLSRTLSSLRPGDNVSVTYFLQGHYVTLDATLEKTDAYKGVLLLSGIPVPFDDLFDISMKDD